MIADWAMYEASGRATRCLGNRKMTSLFQENEACCESMCSSSILCGLPLGGPKLPRPRGTIGAMKNRSIFSSSRVGRHAIRSPARVKYICWEKLTMHILGQCGNETAVVLLLIQR